MTYYIQNTKTTVDVYKSTPSTQTPTITHSKILASFPKFPDGHAQARTLINQLEGKPNEIV